MADDYHVPKATAQEIDSKTVQVDINIPGLEVEIIRLPWSSPKLKDSCTVTPTFHINSLEVIAVVTKKGMENKFKYAIKKLPGDIDGDKCTTEYRDDYIKLTLHKAEPSSSWQVQMKKGLEQATA